MAAAPQSASLPTASPLVVLVVPISVMHSHSMTSCFLPARPGICPDGGVPEARP